jgi:hypothetical protein
MGARTAVLRERVTSMAMEESGKQVTRARRHLVSVGEVESEVVASAARIWRAGAVNGQYRDADTVLVLFDPDRASTATLVDVLSKAGAQGAALGVLPIYAREKTQIDLQRLLGQDRLEIDFSQCRFRLGGSPAANSSNTPWVLGRALQDDGQAVAEDISQPGLLFLQGHSGPVDGSFGSWLTLCSRALHRPDVPVFFPCAGTERCFRQQSQGRADTSDAGLIDPRLLRSKLVVLDGCGTFAVAGSIYRYEQSILRALTLSSIQASILSLGVSATPLAAVVLLMGLLARGRTLGEAVRDTNRYRQEAGSPTSMRGSAVAPWIVVGNPAATVAGLPLVERRGERNAAGDLEFVVPQGGWSAATGTLVALPNVAAADGPFDILCSPQRWAHGALHDDGCAYLWLGDCEPLTQVGHEADTRIALAKRPDAGAAVWRESFLWLQVCSPWLRGVATTVAKRQRDNAALLSLIDVRAALAADVEFAACATASKRRTEIAAPVEVSATSLSHAVEQLDRATARIVGAAIPHAGARLSHLWSPPWLYEGYAAVDEKCACSCVIAGHVRRHAVYELLRVELSCPACSLIGDVAACTEIDPARGVVVRPMAKASMGARSLIRNDELRWEVQCLPSGSLGGYACATLFDPFRNRHVFTDAVPVPSRELVAVSMDIPDDWPVGMSWATLTLTVGGRISLFAFDVDVQERNG